MRCLPVLLLAVSACGPEVVPEGSAADADPSQPTAPDARSQSEFTDAGPPGVCAEQDFAIELVPPHMMILLDKSSSMGDSIGGGGSKMSQAKAAIDHVVTAYQDLIRFGFDAFPSSDNCNVGDPIVLDVVDDVAENLSVASAMWGTSANGGSTPLYCGLGILADPGYAPNFNNPGANKYVVVVSDGADLCGEGCCVPMPSGWPPLPPPECVADDAEFANLATSLRNQHAIKSIVIGFDDPGGENVAEGQLNAIAANGGTPFTEFLFASSQSQLEDAFDQIAAQVVSCTYALEDPGEEANPDEVNVYFDGVPVGFDEGCLNGGGWDWTDDSHTAIHFCVGACDELQNLTVDNINITFGCPTIIIE